MKYGKSDKVLDKRHAQYKKKACSTAKKGSKATQTSFVRHAREPAIRRQNMFTE